MIPVTKSFLPPIDEYMSQVNRAYKNEWLTNRGELVLELETKISNYLQLVNTNILCTNNGTTPLQIALKSLGGNGEVITTPFSYVATTAAIVWEGCSPVFVDIHPEYLTIDETKIEDAITSKTTCILATHVYGNPCNIDYIEKIAKKHKLKVIYDAAHCFGVQYKGKSIFEYGDVSTCSFHATKIFHTGEGGAIFCNNNKLFKELYYRHNFGHSSHETYDGLGINGKMSELQAAMGLTILPYMDEIITYRKELCDFYEKELLFNSFRKIKFREEGIWNNSYFPIIFENETQLNKANEKLKEKKINARRYFFPSLEKLPYINQNNCYLADEISKNVICLPLYHSMVKKDLINIIKILNT